MDRRKEFMELAGQFLTKENIMEMAKASDEMGLTFDQCIQLIIEATSHKVGKYLEL